MGGESSLKIRTRECSRNAKNIEYNLYTEYFNFIHLGIIVDIGKIKVKEILTEAYLYAIEQTAQQNFSFDTLDDYPRGIVISFITKKDR